MRMTPERERALTRTPEELFLVKARALVATAMVMALVGLPAATDAQGYRATDDIPRYEDYLRVALPGAETFRFVDRPEELLWSPHARGSG